MLAATACDVDGLSILAGQNAYWDYHHTLGHNLPFGLLFCLALAAFSARRALAFTVYLALFHLHLLLDYFGSGPGWGIPYFWPFSKHVSVNPSAWAFYSWQNLTAAGMLVIWTLWIIRRDGRTPLEAVMPNLDRQLVAALGGRAPRSRRARGVPCGTVPPGDSYAPPGLRENTKRKGRRGVCDEQTPSPPQSRSR
jgi:hypothetical protein